MELDIHRRSVPLSNSSNSKFLSFVRKFAAVIALLAICPYCRDSLSVREGMNKKGVFEVQIWCDWCDKDTFALLVTEMKRSDLRRYLKGAEGKENRTLSVRSLEASPKSESE